MQYVAASVPPEQFIFFALEHFNVLRILSRTLLQDAPLSPEESVLTQECLSLLLKLTLGRCHVGASDEEKLRREVIAWLACGDVSAARLAARLSPEFRSAKATSKLDAALSAVAQATAPQSLTEEKLYRLRTECWAELDPYFWAYRSGDLQSAEDNYRQVRLPTALALWPLHAHAQFPFSVRAAARRVCCHSTPTSRPSPQYSHRSLCCCTRRFLRTSSDRSSTYSSRSAAPVRACCTAHSTSCLLHSLPPRSPPVHSSGRSQHQARAQTLSRSWISF